MPRFFADVRIDIDATTKENAQEILESLVLTITEPGVEDAEIIIDLEEIE